MEFRNIAIIAHVDHGKTTLVDGLLRQCKAFQEHERVVDRVMDSMDLERERGITIAAKNTAVFYRGFKINICDTPGHADFGGEVERVLNMVDAVVLVVDAFEGPMPQTRYVLEKALATGMKVLVVINKCDKPAARPAAVLDLVFDLFVELKADDHQLDFPVLYASGRDGWVRAEPDGPETDTRLLFDAIEEHVPAPDNDPAGAARMMVTTIDHNDFVGRIAVGKVNRGVIQAGQTLAAATPEGAPRNGKVTGLFGFAGLDRVPVKEAVAGDICAIQGFPEITIGATLCDPNVVEPLETISIDEPTIAMEFLVNDSPFMGQEGKLVTGRQIGDRLRRELRSNVALRLGESGGDSTFPVSGRGVLHLGILIETMRREGYELAVSRPRVIDHYEDGERLEPIETLVVDAPADISGKVIELVCGRRGELEDMNTEGATTRITFTIASRGLIGLRSKLLTLTSGEAVMSHILKGYEPFKGTVPRRGAGVIVSSHAGQVTNYALDGLQDRGDFFVAPGEQVYIGQIVGEHCKGNDIEVNPTREKKLTNVRASGTDRSLKVAPPRLFSLEEALEYIEEDELLEVTPDSLRLRKKELDSTKRKREAKREAAQA